jgi:hypothetical protein
MRKIILTVLGATLIAGSTAQVAVAERHHVRKVDRAAVSLQFRDASNAFAWPPQSGPYSDYTEGHVISAPAGH